MTESLCKLHSFLTGVKTVRRKTSWKQPWNWMPSAVPRMCRSEPSLPHDYHVTEGHVSSKACRSPRQSNRKNSRLAPRALSATREGRELQTTAGNSSWDKAEERTEHARYQLEIHLTVTLCYDFKGNYKVCRSTGFVSQLSSTVARKCKLRLGEEGIRSRLLSSLVQPDVSV